MTSGESGTVSVLDLVNLRHDRVLRVGVNPNGVVANPVRNEVYVVNSGTAAGNGSLSVIDTVRNAVIATIRCIDCPPALASTVKASADMWPTAGPTT